MEQREYIILQAIAPPQVSGIMEVVKKFMKLQKMHMFERMISATLVKSTKCKKEGIPLNFWLQHLIMFFLLD